MSTDKATSDDLQLGDYLVDVSAPTSGQQQLRLIRCPICHENLRDRGVEQVRTHIGEHTPEEAGLTARPTKGVDFDLSPYALAEPILLDAMGVDIDPTVYHPIADIYEEVVAAIADLEPVGYDEINEAATGSKKSTRRAVDELEAAGWVDRAGKGHRGRILFALSTTDSYDHLYAHEYPEVVELIRNHGAVSVNTTAERVGMTKSAARARIDNLEGEGSIEFVAKGHRGCHLYSTTESAEAEL